MSKHDIQTKLSYLKGDKVRELGEQVPQPSLEKLRLDVKHMWKTMRFDLLSSKVLLQSMRSPPQKKKVGRKVGRGESKEFLKHHEMEHD